MKLITMKRLIFDLPICNRLQEDNKINNKIILTLFLTKYIHISLARNHNVYLNKMLEKTLAL